MSLQGVRPSLEAQYGQRKYIEVPDPLPTQYTGMSKSRQRCSLHASRMSATFGESVRECGTHLGLENLQRPILSRRPHLLQLGAPLVERPYGYTLARSLVRG